MDNLARTDRDWVTLLNDNSHSGGVQQNTWKVPKGVRWQFRAGRAISSAAVLRDNVLYVTEIHGVVYALDADTGRPKWTRQFPDWIHSTPAISGNSLLFGCDAGKVHCLARDTGNILWETATHGEVLGSPHRSR